MLLAFLTVIPLTFWRCGSVGKLDFDVIYAILFVRWCI